MKKNNIFIFRVSKGNDSGNPHGYCPLDYSEIKKEINTLTENDIKKIDYDDKSYKKLYLNYLYNELWNNNTLRQGWGIKGLDLNQSVPSWIKMYMLNGKVFWNTDIECHKAKGRWNIISRMLKMEENDFIIIPKTSSNNIANDYNHFVVCQIDKPYYFDYNETIKDFGHCVKIKNLQIFEYSENTLLSKDFSAPYLWAITELKDTHSRFDKITGFIQDSYIQEESINNNDLLSLLCDTFHHLVVMSEFEERQNFNNQITRLIVMKQDKVKIEIRKENVSHNTPHLHITHTDKIDVSISLIDFSILAGNIDRKYKKKLLSILEPHKSQLNEIWDELNEKDNFKIAEKLINDLGL